MPSEKGNLFSSLPCTTDPNLQAVLVSSVYQAISLDWRIAGQVSK
jgi:hypothetical protein